MKPDGWYSSFGEPEVELIPITPKLIATSRDSVVAELPADLLAYRQEQYLIGPGDTLYITVWDHPELTVPTGTQINSSDANGRLVAADGSFFYPYVGMVKAAGRAPDAVRAELAQRLAKYIASPQVDVAVLRFSSQKVFLSGAFRNPAPLPITTTPLSLAEALGRGGISTTEAELPAMELIRDGIRYSLNYDRLSRQGISLEQIFLKANDTLSLPYNDRRKIYVMGEVSTQRALSFKTDGMSLADALTSVGGLRQTSAKARSVYVIRGVDTDSVGPTATVYQLNANSVVSLMLADRFQLQAGDMVYVGPAQVARWNRFISQLLPSVNLLRSGVNIAENLDDI